MKNLPVWEDVVSFFKDHIKIIASTIAICIIFYSIGVGYSFFSNAKVENSNEIVLQQESLDDEETILTKKELDELQKKIVSFDFYVENDEAVQFTNYNLLKKLLIAPDTIKMIEEKANSSLKPSPKLAVNVSLDHETYLLTLSIGTGDYKLNKIISNAYYESFQDGSIPFFENKFVYMASTPKLHKESAEEKQQGTLVEENIAPSLTKIALYSLIVLVGSAILGVIISLISAILRKEIVDSFSYGVKENDVVLNFTNFKNVSNEELAIKLGHAINHPLKKVKVILSEQPLEKELVRYLKQNEKKQAIDIEVNNTEMVMARDLSEIDPLLPVEEVVLIIKKKITTKNWYKMQRVQLENYNASVKVIQIP